MHNNLNTNHTQSYANNVNKLSEATVYLYQEQVNISSPWFILDPVNGKILIRSNNFNKLFECDCESHDLSLNELPITQESYDDLVREVNYTAQSNLFASSLIALEMQCNKIIPLWLSLQPIIIDNSIAGILVYVQPVETPEYMNNLIKKHKVSNTSHTFMKSSDNGTNSYAHQNNQTSPIKNKFADVQNVILNLVIAGFSQREIGEKLELSRTRIAQHITHICNSYGIVGGSSKLLKKHFNQAH